MRFCIRAQGFSFLDVGDNGAWRRCGIHHSSEFRNITDAGVTYGVNGKIPALSLDILGDNVRHVHSNDRSDRYSDRPRNDWEKIRWRVNIASRVSTYKGFAVG